MKHNLFFSTANKGTKIYDILIGSTFLHANKSKDLVLLYKDQTTSDNSLRGFSFGVLTLLLKSLLIALFSPNNVSLIRYRDISIGRYAVSTAYRSFDAYNNRIIFILKYLKSIYRCAQIIQGIEHYKQNIDSAFIDHGCYENGVYFDIFSKLGIAIYFNDYPFGLVRWEPSEAGGYETALQVNNYKVSPADLAMGKKELKLRTKDSNKISYLSVDFENYSSNQQFDYIIYAHSFTDAQNIYGYDGAFNNVMEWLEFTLNQLDSAKVCVKAHPGIYLEGCSSQVVDWDRRLFAKLTTKYKNKKNIHIIDYAITNLDLLNSISKKTILVSHHSNALLEGGSLGFKCICSKASTWSNFTLFNSWENRDMYQRLLSLPFQDLSETNQTELFRYYFILHYGEASFFSSHWLEQIAKIIDMDYKHLFIDATCIEDLSPQIVDRCIENISAGLVTC